MTCLSTVQCGDCDWIGPEDDWDGHECSYRA